MARRKGDVALAALADLSPTLLKLVHHHVFPVDPLTIERGRDHRQRIGGPRSSPFLRETTASPG